MLNEKCGPPSSPMSLSTTFPSTATGQRNCWRTRMPGLRSSLWVPSCRTLTSSVRPVFAMAAVEAMFRVSPYSVIASGHVQHHAFGFLGLELGQNEGRVIGLPTWCMVSTGSIMRHLIFRSNTAGARGSFRVFEPNQAPTAHQLQ